MRVFISYAHSDARDLVLKLVPVLEQAGERVWYDQSGLSGGEIWSAAIERAIDESEVIVAVLSRAAQTSDICRAEQLRALRHNKRVIPYLLDKDADRPLHLETRQFVTDPAELVRAIQHPANGYEATLKTRHRSTYQTTPPLPPNFVARDELMHALRQRVISARPTHTPVAITAIRGMAGIGKTVLAQALCYDSVIQDAFPDGVHWAAVGQEPTETHLIAQLREIGKGLGDTEAASWDSLIAATNRLRFLLQDKAALIVADNVWSGHDLAPFYVDSLTSRLLITTRDGGVAASVGATELQLETMEEEQGRAVLAQAAGISVAELPAEAGAILDLCGGLPLALSLIGALARGQLRRWPALLRQLQAADLARIRLEYPNYPFPDVFRAIEASIESLSPESRKRYLEMAVFPSDTPIPAAAAAILWGTSVEEAENQLYEWTLQSLGTSAGNGFQLHDLQMACVRQQFGPAVELHRRIVAGYGRLCQDGWMSGPDDGYFFSWIATHIKESGDKEGLHLLLLNAGWLRAKLRIKGIAALLADFDLADGRSGPGTVGEALRLSAHVLASDATQLTGQLLGRLRNFEAAELQDLLQGLIASQPRPWIEPLGDALEAPGGAVIATLSGHHARVAAVAFGPGPDRLTSASEDGTIKTWDLRQWKCVETVDWKAAEYAALVPARGLVLSGRRIDAEPGNIRSRVQVTAFAGNSLAELNTVPAAMLNSLAAAPNGRYAVTAFNDARLEVWDLTHFQRQAARKITERLYCAAVMSDGRRAILSVLGYSWDYRGQLLLIDLETGDSLNTWSLPNPIYQVALDADERSVFCLGGSSLDILELAGGVLWSGTMEPVKAATALCADSRTIAFGLANGLIRIVDRSRMTTVAEVTESAIPGSEEPRLDAALFDDDDPIESKLICDHGRTAFTLQSSGAIKVWDLTTATPASRVIDAGDQEWYARYGDDSINRIREDAPNFLTGMELAVNRDQSYLAARYSSRDLGVIKVWKLATAELVCTLSAADSRFWVVRIDPSGRRVVSASSDHEIRVWSLPGGQIIHTLVKHTGGIFDLQFPQPDRLISLGHDQRMCVWDLDSGALVFEFERVWDGDSSQLGRRIGDYSEVSLAFPPGGRLAATGADDRSLKVWNLENGSLMARFDCDRIPSDVHFSSESRLATSLGEFDLHA